MQRILRDENISYGDDYSEDDETGEREDEEGAGGEGAGVRLFPVGMAVITADGKYGSILKIHSAGVDGVESLSYDVYFPGLPPRFRVPHADLRPDPDGEDSDVDEDDGQEFHAAREVTTTLTPATLLPTLKTRNPPPDPQNPQPSSRPSKPATLLPNRALRRRRGANRVFPK